MLRDVCGVAHCGLTPHARKRATRDPGQHTPMVYDLLTICKQIES